MNDSGNWWIGLALLALALFPLYVYLFFKLVVLDRKSEALLAELRHSRAFEMHAIQQQWSGPDHITKEMQMRYGYKRFSWPVLLLVLFNVICFSIVWDIVRHRFEGSWWLLYNPQFLEAAELPMMAFLGVSVFNIGHMLRRLYVWDVTTHVFWNALHRTWLVLGVATVLAASMCLTIDSDCVDEPWWKRGHAAFFALGFLVNPALRDILRRGQAFFQISRPQAPELPLSLIQGISFWHEYRLEEEGIDNVQNLATCDLIDLAITTRYNLRTLLDWVDQAILIHRMGQKANTLRDASFITGAIDMAWASPNNSAGGRTDVPKHIAKTIDAEVIYVELLMNSLHQDTQVQMLWDLWQSELDSKTKGKSNV